MGGHEQSVLHKTIKVHLKCSIFKSQIAAFFLLSQSENSQRSSDCSGQGRGGQDREQTEPQGKRSSRGKVCTFHPISTMLPPVDTSARETRNLTKPSLVPCLSPQQRKTCAWEEGLFIFARDSTKLDKSRCRQYRSPNSSPIAVFIP